MGRFRKSGLVVLLMIGGLLPVTAWAQKAKASREYDLKAVFLFNFAQFVDWPPETFAEKDTPFVIGILGNDPFGRNLDDVVANETVRGHPIVVRRFKNPEECVGCQILFVPATETRLTQLFKLLNNKPVLTVGETESFVTRGGMIRFATAQNRVRLTVNLEAAKLARLVISSKLLRQSELVDVSNRP